MGRDVIALDFDTAMWANAATCIIAPGREIWPGIITLTKQTAKSSRVPTGQRTEVSEAMVEAAARVLAEYADYPAQVNKIAVRRALEAALGRISVSQ